VIVATGLTESEFSGLAPGADSIWVALTVADTIRGTALAAAAGGLTIGVRCESPGEVGVARRGFKDGAVLDAGAAGAGGGGGVCTGTATDVAGVCGGGSATAEVAGVAAAFVAAVTCPTVLWALCPTVSRTPEPAAAAVPVPSSNVRHVATAPIPRRRCPERGCRALVSIEAV
jgi:hypothetical protein